MNRSRLHGLFQLLRIELSFAAGVCVVLAEVLVLGNWPPLLPALCGFIAVFSIAASLLVHNDVIDIETDRTNAPTRPLPSGMATKQDAIALSVMLAFAGFISAVLIGFNAFVMACSMLTTGLLYNWKLKKYGVVGNLFVGISVGMSFVFGGIAVGNPFDRSVLFLAVMTMFVDLGEEIAADALDVEGDRLTDSRSLAVIFGPEKAMRIAATIFALVIVISSVPFIAGWFGMSHLPPIIAFDTLVAWSVWRLLDPQTPGKHRYIRCIYLSGTAMLLAMIVLRLVE